MSDGFQPNLDFKAANEAAEDGEALIIDLDGYEGPLHVLLALVASVLSGCDSSPSTPLAPDKPAPPDASKLPAQDMDRLLKQNHEDATRR